MSHKSDNSRRGGPEGRTEGTKKGTQQKTPEGRSEGAKKGAQTQPHEGKQGQGTGKKGGEPRHGR